MPPRYRKSIHSLWLICPGSQLPLIFCLLFRRDIQSHCFPECSALTYYHNCLVSAHCILKYCSTQFLRKGLIQVLVPKKYLFWKVYFLIQSGVLFGKTTDWYRHLMLGPQFPLQAITTLGQPLSYSCLNQMTLGGRDPYCAWQGVYQHSSMYPKMSA